MSDTLEEAISRWNTRASPAPQGGEREILKKLERCLTKDSLTDNERVFDALIVIRRALAAFPSPAVSGILWCCHVRGPDDVYAAPNYETALAWSDAMNEINWKANSNLNIGDPKSFQDCLIKAVPAPWPHSSEAHAKNLPESIAGFSSPSLTDKRPPMQEDGK